MRDLLKLKRICEREGILNDDGFQPHHCFFRSEYFEDDWDEEWNLEPLYVTKHIGGEKSVHGGNLKLDEKLKNKALSRYCGKHRNKLIEIMKRRAYEIGKSI